MNRNADGQAVKVVLGTRVNELREELSLEKQAMTEFLGFSPSAFSKWLDQDRTGKDPDYSTVKQVASALQWSIDYLAGATDERWAPAVLRTQPHMRRWAASRNDLRQVSRAVRMVAGWEEFHSRVPAFAERTWLLYLHWRSKDWADCRTGDLLPSALQIEAASRITGIPDLWFMNGDTNCLNPISDTERRVLEEYMASENIDPDELLKGYRQSKNPRA